MRTIAVHHDRPLTYLPLPPRDGGLGYTPASLPSGESARLVSLRETKILDTEEEQFYDELTFLASTICETPIALVSFVDDNRQWFKSRLGIEARETPRDWSFCAHAILEPDRIFEVPDTLDDPRYAGNPMVQGGPRLRSYAGAPIVVSDGAALGTLCVVDTKPHPLSDIQRKALRCLARRAGVKLEMRNWMERGELKILIDPLTGVFNRPAFDLHLQEEWERHYRLGDWLGLLMIDVDLDDARSELEADSFLARVATILGSTLGRNDYLARYRGDKFALLLPGKDSDAASAAGERLREAVFDANWGWWRISVSIGADAVRRSMELDANLLVARANRALYQAKKAGGNCIVGFRSWLG